MSKARRRNSAPKYIAKVTRKRKTPKTRRKTPKSRRRGMYVASRTSGTLTNCCVCFSSLSKSPSSGTIFSVKKRSVAPALITIRETACGHSLFQQEGAIIFIIKFKFKFKKSNIIYQNPKFNQEEDALIITIK